MNKPEDKAAIAPVVKSEVLGTADGKGQTTPIFVEAEKMFEKFAEMTKDIGHRAFQFFEERGAGFGRDLDDWLKAERELLRPVPIEITEKDGNLLVAAAVPSFKPEEIEISVKDDQLVISGKTEKREEKKGEKTIYSDFESARFFRQITLPSAVDADNSKAELKEGVLTVTLPEVAAQKPKTIAVSG